MPFAVPDDATGATTAKYEAAVLDAVLDGSEVAHTWSEVTSDAKGPSGTTHHGVFLMSTDAMKIAGVRWGMGARLMQQVADVIGALLPTIRLRDLLWLQRGVKLNPVTASIVGIPYGSSKTADMRKYSAMIDDWIAKAGGSGIVQTTGKPWVLTNALLNHPGMACNFGWHFPGSSYGGLTGEASPAFPNLRVLQGPGFAHGLDQSDFSEVPVFVHRRVVVDGADRDLIDVLADPELAPLASHEGVIKVPGMRQPGVPVACRVSGLVASNPNGACPMPPKPTNTASWWSPLKIAGAVVFGTFAAAGLGYGAHQWWLHHHARAT
jgi:hypothetical protein